MGAVVRSTFERNCVSSGLSKFLGNSNKWLSIADDGALKGIQHGTNLFILANPNAEKRIKPVADKAADGRSLISAFRFIFPLYEWFTGRALWMTDSKGWRRIRFDKTTGKPIEIARSDLLTNWTKDPLTKMWIGPAGEISLDGKYIDDEKGRFAFREWEDIAMDAGVLGARILSPWRWVHTQKMFDIGEKHAQRIGNVIMAFWGGVLALNLVVSVKSLVNEADPDEVPKKIWEAGQAALDFAALPFDFDVGSKIPALRALGAGLNLAAAISLIAKDIYYYE